jgi:hypothetical protein
MQVYEPGKGLSFHFDKDEAKLVSSGEMHHPILSSVLYLTGTAEAGGCREGKWRKPAEQAATGEAAAAAAAAAAVETSSGALKFSFEEVNFA